MVTYEDLVLLSKTELKELPTWTTMTNIMGEKKPLAEIDIDTEDTRFDVTAWGLPIVEFDQVGDVTVKKVTADARIIGKVKVEMERQGRAKRRGEWDFT